MYKCNAQRLLELELGHVVDHGLHAFDFFVDREGGVVVIFEVYKEYRADVLGNHKVDGVFPIDIYGQTVVIVAFNIIEKGVKHSGVGDALAYGTLVVDDDVHANGWSDVLTRNPNAVLVVVAFLHTESTFVGQLLIHHEGDFSRQGAHVDLESLVLGLVRTTGRKGEVGRGEEGRDDGGVVGVFLTVGELGAEGNY